MDGFRQVLRGNHLGAIQVRDGTGDLKDPVVSARRKTEAAHRLCVNIPADRRAHYLQPAVGHYGVFNGSRFRAEIAPRIADFILSNDHALRRPWRRAVAAKG